MPAWAQTERDQVEADLQFLFKEVAPRCHGLSGAHALRSAVVPLRVG